MAVAVGYSEYADAKGGDQRPGSAQGIAYERLHQLSGKKREYIHELKKLLEKEQQSIIESECSFKPAI